MGLAFALAEYGPISICVDSSGFDDYTGGVITYEECGGENYQIDHCIQLVGFNWKAEKPYWIVKNSWSTSWGLNGYAYLEYGKNTCGVASHAAYPILNGTCDATSEAYPILNRTSDAAYQRFYKQATTEP